MKRKHGVAVKKNIPNNEVNTKRIVWLHGQFCLIVASFTIYYTSQTTKWTLYYILHGKFSILNIFHSFAWLLLHLLYTISQTTKWTVYWRIMWLHGKFSILNIFHSFAWLLLHLFTIYLPAFNVSWKNQLKHQWWYTHDVRVYAHIHTSIIYNKSFKIHLLFSVLLKSLILND